MAETCQEPTFSFFAVCEPSKLKADPCSKLVHIRLFGKYCKWHASLAILFLHTRCTCWSSFQNKTM